MESLKSGTITMDIVSRFSRKVDLQMYPLFIPRFFKLNNRLHILWNNLTLFCLFKKFAFIELNDFIVN